MVEARRQQGIDFVRAIAIVFVIAVHFMEYDGYFSSVFIGFSMVVQTFCRSIFLSCIPLFFIVMGYLGHSKMPILSYYKKILPTLGSYILIATLYIVFQVNVLHVDIPFMVAINMILKFEEIPYAWYFLQYIPLFLIVPFLNTMYLGLESKKAEVGLLAVFIALTVVPTLINPVTQILFGGTYVIETWQEIYPVAYYLMGIFIKVHQPKVRTMWLVVMILAVASIQTALSYLHSMQNVPDRYFLFGYYQWPTAFVATSVFLLFYQRQIASNVVCRSVTAVAKRTLDIFLFSIFFDTVFYNYLWNVPIENAWIYLLPTVALSILTCMMLVVVKETMIKLVKIIFFYIKQRWLFV